MRAMILLFVSFAAFASTDGGWQKIPAGSPLRALYPDKNEVGLFAPDDSESTELPPAHLLIYPTSVNVGFKQQSKQLAANVFSKLEVNLRDRATYQLVHDSFKAGPRGELNAMVFLAQSTHLRATYMTCVAVIQKQNKMHVVFMSSYKEAFQAPSSDESRRGEVPTYDKYECSKRLVELARTNLLYQ